ncbi:hypothetical protein B4U79_09649 [Dinothrombium tinctorium]|uniref:Saccharopine dehydrogenase NADP binding domain-containing protein n=1 Tax=Dinothrombium tinctorium TaxID=1965070 RepID=A0A3S3Q675_9ACAR|nr:hypothetical protein B4U79_12897 [Dinothrombium tinctorium]RWS04351.1 hypothetical protein B4U79_14117 [Dinothrombium tinctorium]RWS08677.1 hypothetical protein B4U79_09649 [Dinothrombium tinctorium]
MKGRAFDIVVLGATGYTGRVIVNDLLAVNKNLNWAIAGRSEAKLRSLWQAIGNKVPKLIFDVFDRSSLNRITKETKLIINCVGPYSLFGESVVRSCVENGTHYIDVSGEPLFLEKTQLNFHEEALRRNVFVIGSCGFDSLPADLAVCLVKKRSPEIKSIETFLTTHYESKFRFNLGTWESLVFGFANYQQLKEVRKQLFADFEAYPSDRKALRKIEGKFVIPFLGSDRSVIKRTQLLNNKYFATKVVPVETYFVCLSKLQLFSLFTMISLITPLSRFKGGRSLLMKHPRIFSFGMTGVPMLTEEEMSKASFEMRVNAHHFDESLSRVKITGPEAGYKTASICCIQSALTLLNEHHNIPLPGGVLTPGFAFQNTKIISNLSNYNIKFEFTKTK